MAEGQHDLIAGAKAILPTRAMPHGLGGQSCSTTIFPPPPS